jgi:Domain of unknown function (DUF4160)
MPTIFRSGSYRFYFYSHEPNEPPHVHVDSGAFSVKIWLFPVSVTRNRGFRAHELGIILRLVRENAAMLLEEWNGYFSDSNR